MEIYLEEGQDLGREQMDKLRKAAEILLRQEGIDSSRAELSLTIVEPEEIRELNREYRGVDKVTDVLSFPQFEDMGQIPEEGEICLGDVVICDEKVRQQAEEYGHSLRREICFLFTHGLLHCFGYDHMQPDEEKIMFDLQHEILDPLVPRV